MDELLECIKHTDQKVHREIEKRWKEFKRMRNADESEWFSELCFCILTANTSAEMGIRVQNALGYEGFAHTPPEELPRKLKEAGSRFYNTRAKYIIGARKFDGMLKKKIQEYEDPRDAREWLVKNIKGLGYKEASHFLRNVGVGNNLAIVDLHILRMLNKHGIVNVKKPITKKKYVEIEKVLNQLAEKSKMPMGKLDLYLWYLSSGKVLK